MPASDEVESLRVGVPAESVNVRVELLSHILLLAGSEIVHAETVAVALISVVLHRLPSHVLAVGREQRIGVVAHVEVALLMVNGLGLHCLGGVDFRGLISLRLAEVLGRT